MYFNGASIERKECAEILIEHTLKKNPAMEMPSFIKRKEALVKHWNACKANIKEEELSNWEVLAIPSTEIEEASHVMQSICMIQ